MALIAATRPLALAADTVHVWRLDLEPEAAARSGLWAVLDADEAARAAAFVFERDRDRFVAAHALLRQILGAYLGAPAADLGFVHGPHGKPALASPWSASDLRFNLSHSQAVGLCAVTRGHDLGVDVEGIRELDDLEALAERVCSARERAALDRLSGPARRSAFFHVWARKEAFVKALGEGLSYPIERVDVALAPTVPARLEGRARDARGEGHWWVLDVPVDTGYAAALVVGGRRVTLSVRRWPDDAPGAAPRWS